MTPFGYDEIRANETAWVVNYERLVREAFDAFTATALRLPSCGDFTNIQIETVHIPGLIGTVGLRTDGDSTTHILGETSGTVFYGDMTYIHTFGYVVLTGGQLLIGRTWFYSEVPAQGMVITETGATGPGWVLTLNPGYRIHAGEGYYEVRR